MEEDKKLEKRKNLEIIVLGVIIIALLGALIYLLFIKKELTDEEVILKYHKNNIYNRSTYMVNSDLDILKKEYDLYKNYVKTTESKEYVNVMIENQMQSSVTGLVNIKIVDNSVNISFANFKNLDNTHQLEYLNDKVISIPIEIKKVGLPLYLVNDENFIYVITDKNIICQYRFHFGNRGELIEYSKFIRSINEVANTFSEFSDYNYIELIEYTFDSGTTRNKIYGLTKDNEVINLVTEDSTGIYNDHRPIDIQKKYNIGNNTFIIDYNGKIKDESSNKYLIDENNQEIIMYAIFDYNFEDYYIVDINMNVYKIADYRNKKLVSNCLKKEKFKISKFLLINGNADFLIYDEKGKRIDLDSHFKKRQFNIWIASSH